MNYTFTNSSIVSVNSGTIVLNVSGKTRTFTDAELVSAVAGEIVLNLPEAFVSNGAYLSIHLIYDTSIHRTFIAKSAVYKTVYYHISQCANGIKDSGCWEGSTIIRYATPEEIQELDDQLAAEGKRWNPGTMQIEKFRWKPVKNTKYFYILISGGVAMVDDYTWMDDHVDKNFYEMGNCFKTRKEAEAKLEQIKKLLLEV